MTGNSVFNGGMTMFLNSVLAATLGAAALTLLPSCNTPQGPDAALQSDAPVDDAGGIDADIRDAFIRPDANADAPFELLPFTPPTSAHITTDRRFFRDEAGRVRVFRGVNVRVEDIFDVRLDPARCPPPTDVLQALPTLPDAELIRMRRLGFNVVRLPIQWSGIEPTQGTFDEVYLDRVEALVTRMEAAGLYVMIDFHQDAWGKDVGEDGAPSWTLPDSWPLLCGPLGDMLAMRRADTLPLLARFFNDRDADPIDVALQEAFMRMAEHVASRFATHERVLGYDLFNEPVADAGMIERFHARLAPRVRAQDSRHILFFEPSAVRNFTDRGPIASEPFPDPLGSYAVHLYTLSFSDPRGELDTVTRMRLEPNVTRAVREAASFQAPLFVGEWGIRPDSPGSANYVRFMYELFDDQFASSTVWLWKENSQGSWGFFDFNRDTGTFTERASVVGAHARVYAAAIAGEPLTMAYVPETHSFTLTYTGRLDAAPSVIHLPESPHFPTDFEVTCNGRVLSGITRNADGNIEVLCPGPFERTVTVVGR